MQFVTGLISTTPVVPAAPAIPSAPAATDDAGDVAAIITALAAPESSGASAAPLEGAMCSESCDEERWSNANSTHQIRSLRGMWSRGWQGI